MANNTKQQGKVMASGQLIVSSNKAKTHSNKIDAAAWTDSHFYHYKRFTFDSNRMKVPKNGRGYIFGNRVLNTYYELTARYDDDNGGKGFFILGIADASYKNKQIIGSS